MKRVRKAEAEENAEKRKKHKDEEKKKRKSEDWCFICKDGGKLYLCGHEECVKAYHSGCLKKRKFPAPSSKLSWHCGRHTCSECHDPSTFFCYCCPTALCNDCVDAAQFLLIRKQHGFCYKCRRHALFLENEKVELKDLNRSSRLFKEYYEIVKKEECLNPKDLQSPEERSEIQQKHKSSPSSNNGCDSIEGVEKDEKMKNLKKFKRQRNRKSNSSEKSQNEAVLCKASEVSYASVVSENISLVYLKRSLIQELLREPESFESKVKGSYVRVKSAASNGLRSNTYQLVQVTGVKKASCGQDTDIKLQLLDMPNDICINLLSDANFSEAECEDLRQKMKVGLLKKPTVDELEEKARSLHKDITDHRIAREKRVLQCKIDDANEKGRRSMLFRLLEERQRLETPSKQLRLLNTPPKVIAEVPGPISENILSDTKENEVVPKSSPISNELKDVSNVKPMDERKQHECSLESVPINNVETRTRSTSAIPYASLSKDAFELNLFSEDRTNDQNHNESSCISIPINNETKGEKSTSAASEIKVTSKDTDERRKTNGSPGFIPIDNECAGKKTASDASEIESISKDTGVPKKTSSSPRFIPMDNEYDGDKTASDASEIKYISKDTDEHNRTNGSRKFIAIDNQSDGEKAASGTSFPFDVTTDHAVQPTYLSCGNTSDGGEQSASNPGEQNPQNLTSAASIGDVDLDELLDQLIKPDVSCASVDGVFSEAGKRMEEVLILSWKSVPITDFKRMVAMANALFTFFNCLRINYSYFYERVKDYICCSALVASTEQFKHGSSLEELAAQYNSEKLCHEMALETYKGISTRVRKLNEQQRLLRDEIAAKKAFVEQLETMHSLHKAEHVSRTRALEEISAKLKKSEDEMRSALEALDKCKKCHFQEAWENFVNAKAALGL